MPDINIKKLRKDFKDVTAVFDLTVTFPSSKVTCLLGPSGCGKTTLMRMIAGLEKPTSGEIFFDDNPITGLSPEKRNIGMVFQYPVVYKGLNVYQNIDLPLKEDKISDTERKNRINEVSEILGIQKYLFKKINQLDSSTCQKIAVARAVARKPQIILFDEPLTNVDVETKVQLKKALKDLTQQLKQTIVYVTHDQTEAMTLADQITLMKDGKIVQIDSPRELYNFPNNIFGGWFLGNPGMNFIETRTVADNGKFKIKNDLFDDAVEIGGVENEMLITLGIRPENINVYNKKEKKSVQANVVYKSIQAGGQYLLSLKVGDISLKAKIRSEIGRKIEQKAWIQLPGEHVKIFSEEGMSTGATLNI